MDDLDTRIIGILQKDGRSSNAGIARELGVSEGTIRRRLKKLVETELIQVIALPDPDKIGFHTEALIAIQVDPGENDTVAEALSNLREINWVTQTAGRYDIFVWASVTTAKELGIFLSGTLGKINGVRHSETFISLANKKRAAGVSL